MEILGKRTKAKMQAGRRREEGGGNLCYIPTRRRRRKRKRRGRRGKWVICVGGPHTRGPHRITRRMRPITDSSLPSPIPHVACAFPFVAPFIFLFSKPTQDEAAAAAAASDIV